MDNIKDKINELYRCISQREDEISIIKEEIKGYNKKIKQLTKIQDDLESLGL